jgi:hypothetical protein
MRLAHRTSRWLRIVADRQGVTVSALARDLRTAPALAREVVRVLDELARAEALELLSGKRPKPLPPDADWLTRHHYQTIKAARDKKTQAEQEAAWQAHMKLQGGT